MVVDADDTYLKFSNPRICQASIDVTDNSTIGAFYRFSPELEQEDYWFMDQDIELISGSGENGIQFKENCRRPIYAWKKLHSYKHNFRFDNSERGES